MDEISEKNIQNKSTVVTEKFDKEVDNAVKKQNQSLAQDQNSVESSTHSNTEKNTNAIPTNIENSFNEISGKFYLKNSPETLAFIDKGQKIQAEVTTLSVTKSLVAIAEERNWTELKVTGNKEFKRSVWLEASQKGIDVKGYNPSEADLAELNNKTKNKDNEATKQSNKDIKKSEVIKDKNQQLDDVVKKHPELINEIAAVKIAEKFSKENFNNDVDRERFVTEVRNSLAADIEKGQQNIEVKIIESKVAEKQQEKEESYEQ